MGYADGADFDYAHPNFKFVPFQHVGVHRNGFERIRYGFNLQAQWIYLFDSDAIHIPSCIGAFERLKTVLRDHEIGSLYCTPYHPEVSNVDGIGYTAKTPGISMMFNRVTAQRLLANENNFFTGNHNGNRHWDNYLGSINRCVNLRASYLEHMGNLTGIHHHYRRSQNRNDVAVNIDQKELADTLARYGLGSTVYKF